MKILMINTASSTIINFRKNLILSLLDKGHSIILITGDSDYEEEILKLKVIRYSVNIDNRSRNPFVNFNYINQVRRIVKFEHPDMVFTFQAKPNTLGIMAVRKYCHNIYAMIEGLGDVFIKRSVQWLAVRALMIGLYKISLKYANKVFFLNQEDKNYFIKKNMVSNDKTVLINGIGINLEYFFQREITNFNTFIMVARLLNSKGVIEYCKAASIIKRMGFNYRFLLVGGEGELTRSDLRTYIEANYIEYLGYQSNIRELIDKSTVFVLPSYREGLPISTLEAMALGRPVITTDVAGCRDTVINNFNGFLVKPRDPTDLALKMIDIMKNRETIISYGANSRKLAEQKFDQHIINDKICSVLFK